MSNLENYINNLITRTVDSEKYIIAIRGSQRKVYDKAYLTKCWLTMSNDTFYNIFGFNWVPPLELQEKVRQRLPGRALWDVKGANTHE